MPRPHQGGIKLGRAWSNEGDQKAANKGWVKKDLANRREELRVKRELVEREAKTKHKVPRCDYCITGEHERCWRAVCHCPCWSDRTYEKLNRESTVPNGDSIVRDEWESYCTRYSGLGSGTEQTESGS